MPARLYFAPPMVSGYNATNGFELVLQDKTGGDINKFSGIAAKFIAALECPARDFCGLALRSVPIFRNT